MSIVHDHRSGRFDRAVALLRKDLDDSANTGALVITVTEADVRAQKGKRQATVPTFAKDHGYSVTLGKRDSNNDCGVLTLASRFLFVAGGTSPVASVNRPEPPDAAWQVVTDRATGQRLLISVFHAPHAVEVAGRFRPGKKAEQWRTEIRNWHKGVEALAAKHHADAVIMTGDWNINLRSKHFRAWLAAEFADWVIPANRPATHGYRAIDFALTRGLDRGGVKALPKSKASDHRGIRNLLDWKKAPMARQARSLDVMLAEVNKHAPNRSKDSDGGLGDQAHASRVSDHNPNEAGVWRARDVTHDPAHGMDADDLANRVAKKLGKHPALGPGAYVIRNRRIISTNRLREGWRPYSGANPHTKHVHISVATNASGYDSREPWHIYQEDDMPYSDWPKADRDALANDVAEAIRRELLTGQTGAPDGRHLGVTLSTIYNAATETRDLVRGLVKGGK